MFDNRDRRRLRRGTRAFAREVVVGEACVFVNHGFQWDGSNNVWLTRARATYVMQAGPRFDLKPRNLWTRLFGLGTRQAPLNPYFDAFFVVRTPAPAGTWEALTVRARTLLVGSFDDARLVSDGKTVTLWREGDFGREADAEAAAELVSEIVSWRTTALDPLRRLPGALYTPAAGRWDGREAPHVNLLASVPVQLRPMDLHGWPVMAARAPCGRATAPFCIELDKPLGATIASPANPLDAPDRMAASSVPTAAPLGLDDAALPADAVSPRSPRPAAAPTGPNRDASGSSPPGAARHRAPEGRGPGSTAASSDRRGFAGAGASSDRRGFAGAGASSDRRGFAGAGASSDRRGFAGAGAAKDAPRYAPDLAGSAAPGPSSRPRDATSSDRPAASLTSDAPSAAGPPTALPSAGDSSTTSQTSSDPGGRGSRPASASLSRSRTATSPRRPAGTPPLPIWLVEAARCLGAARLACDGHWVTLYWGRLESDRDRLLTGARLVGAFASENIGGLYR